MYELPDLSYNIVERSVSKRFPRVIEQLTGHNGEPFTRTPSAKRTLDGFDLSLAFLAELSNADFLADCGSNN